MNKRGKMKNVLVVGVHPDDETLGAGGTILKLKESGSKCHWLIVTHLFEEDGFDSIRVKHRSIENAQVAEMFDFDSVTNLNYHATKLDRASVAELMQSFTYVVDEIKPDTIIFPFHADVHSEHRIIFDCFWACTKSFRYGFIKKILMQETISSTEFAPPIQNNAFLPNCFFDISEFMEKKIDIFKVFKSEYTPSPYPRSEEKIKALASYRGSRIGVEYAEAFMSLYEKF